MHWAVYDSQVNLPVIYIMDVEDTGKIGSAQGRAPLARGAGAFDGASLGGLKLLTIAKGFDEDFDDLHPTTAAPVPYWSDVFERLHDADGPLARGS